MDPQHARQGGQNLFVYSLEGPSVLDIYSKHVVRSTGHQVAFPDLGMPAYGRLKLVEVVLGLPLKRNVDDYGDDRFRPRRVNQRRVAANYTRLLQKLDAPETSGRRKADFCGKLCVAGPCVNPKQPQDVAIDIVRS